MLLRILFVTCVTWKQKKNKTNPHIFIAVSECPFKKKKKFITEIRQPTRWQSRNDVSHVMRILNGSENKSWSLAVSMEYETWLLGGFQGEARSFKCHWRNDVLRPFVYYLVNLGKFLAKTAADLRNFYANIKMSVVNNDCSYHRQFKKKKNWYEDRRVFCMSKRWHAARLFGVDKSRQQ